jgi:hypothetical protein
LRKLRYIIAILSKITKTRWLILTECVSAALTRFWRRSLAAASIGPVGARERIEAAKQRGSPVRLILHSAPLLPAVSFLGGFQTLAGPRKTCAHPSGRHLKPITGADLGLI